MNAPADYEIELRIAASVSSARLYLKLFTVRDERFPYRKEMLPASMILRWRLPCCGLQAII